MHIFKKESVSDTAPHAQYFSGLHTFINKSSRLYPDQQLMNILQYFHSHKHKSAEVKALLLLLHWLSHGCVYANQCWKQQHTFTVFVHKV